MFVQLIGRFEVRNCFTVRHIAMEREPKKVDADIKKSAKSVEVIPWL